MLDNASDDGSAEAVRALGGDIRLIALDRRDGKAANDSRLLEEARGEFCLLLNEDSELQPGAVAGAAGGAASRTGRPPSPAPSCWRPTAARCPAPGGCRAPETALAGAALPAPPADRAERRRRAPARSAGCSRARCWSAARPPSRSAGSTRDFFVYSDETDFCKRLGDAGWRILYVPVGAGHPPRPDGAGRRRGRAADRRVPPQPRPLPAQAPRPRSGRSCCARCSPGPTCCAPLAALVLPGPLARAATGSTPARRCSPAAARGSARPRRRTTGRIGS